MANEEFQVLGDAFTDTSDANRLEFIIERKIREILNTSALAAVSGVEGGGPAGSGFVSATPTVADVGANGQALPMAPIPHVPFGRVQAGCAALIVDPVPGDIGVVSFCKSDSSRGAQAGQAPASFRSFSQADGMYVTAVHTKAATVYIEIKQDNTVLIHAPAGVKIETDANVDINAKGRINLNAPLITTAGPIQQGNSMGGGVSSFKGGMSNTGGTVSSNGIVLDSHVHGGVQSGGSNTGGPR